MILARTTTVGDEALSRALTHYQSSVKHAVAAVLMTLGFTIMFVRAAGNPFDIWGPDLFGIISLWAYLSAPVITLAMSIFAMGELRGARRAVEHKVALPRWYIPLVAPMLSSILCTYCIIFLYAIGALS